MLWALLFVCLLGSSWGDGDVESRVVTIKQGSLRGYKAPDGDFYVFYGVPYATAPTGSNRFKAPLPPPAWRNTFVAVDKGLVICPQYDFVETVWNRKNQQTENCLIANIYVPKTNEKNLSVIVQVHGGAYVIGYGNMMTHKNLVMSKKVIVVNFNYRLGIHGFLCLGTNDIPGNAGMKDQVALFRWVRDNIASFGGNPDDVTALGSSAGSSAVDLLQLSKMTNDLFKRVVPESGANTAAFSVQSNPLDIAKKYAKKLNFSNVDDIYALEEFYKTASYDTLYSVDVMKETDGTFFFSPCVERDTGTETFLDDNPVSILKSGNYQKRPMLYGFADMEGIMRVHFFASWKDRMNAKFSDYLPADLQFGSEEEKEEVAAKIKKFFFGEKPIGEDNILAYVDFFTDTMFAYPTLRSVRLQVEAGNDQIYLYEYSYTDEDTPVIPYTNIRGADHCAQTMAVLDGVNVTHFDESSISNDYKNMKRTLREIWLNFVTTSKPVPERSSFPAWPPTRANGSPYMKLDTVLELKNTPMLEKRMRFWDEIYSKHYRYPVPPGEPPSSDSQRSLPRTDL